MAFKVPERFRVRVGFMGSDESYGNNGLFRIALARGQVLSSVASDALGWEHVSVSRQDRCPTWGEMCQIKAMFWDAEDCVVQYHPPKSEYVDNHAFCLHMWRPVSVEMPRPPSILVGFRKSAV